MRIKVLLLVLILVPFFLYAHNQNEVEKDSINKNKRPSMGQTIPLTTYVVVIATIIAAIVSSGIITLSNLYHRKCQRKALLMVFTTDLVKRFLRATEYEIQNKKGAISYSTLYEATNPNTLVKLAEVIKDKDILHTIVELNGHYYQIQRHVFEASKYAAEQALKNSNYEYLEKKYGEENPQTINASQDLREISVRARAAQTRAIAFFNFKEMLNMTKELINYTKKHANSSFIESLEKQLNQKIIKREGKEKHKKKDKKRNFSKKNHLKLIKIRY